MESIVSMRKVLCQRDADDNDNNNSNNNNGREKEPINECVQQVLIDN